MESSKSPLGAFHEKKMRSPDAGETLFSGRWPSGTEGVTRCHLFRMTGAISLARRRGKPAAGVELARQGACLHLET